MKTVKNNAELSESTKASNEIIPANSKSVETKSNTKYYPEIGDKIKKLRESFQKNGKTMTQDDFADKVGVSPSTLQNAEKGKFSLDTLTMIAKACNVSTDYLLGVGQESDTKAALLVEVLQDHFKVRFEEHKASDGKQRKLMFVTISDSLYKTLEQLALVKEQRLILDGVSDDTYRRMETDIIQAYNATLNDKNGKSTEYAVSEYTITTTGTNTPNPPT